MSELPDHEPICTNPAARAVELAILARPRDLGGFTVRRVLPSPRRRLVGPFVFFDHMGPIDFAPGQGIDVRPHPHIGLATVTYLFDGEIMHRDSVGSKQPIRPGDVNWMVAGRGIAHSERSAPDVRAQGGKLHGIQSWVALPEAHEEVEPRFDHHPAATLPLIQRPGVALRVIAGTAFGAEAPTRVLSPTLYVHAHFQQGAELVLDDAHEERAVYAVDATLQCEGVDLPPGTMFVLLTRKKGEKQGAGNVTVRAITEGHAMIVGGAPMEGPRHIWWNFVSSSEARIERAKADWRAHRFGVVVEDEREFIPLPER